MLVHLDIKPENIFISMDHPMESSPMSSISEPVGPVEVVGGGQGDINTSTVNPAGGCSEAVVASAAANLASKKDAFTSTEEELLRYVLRTWA